MEQVGLTGAGLACKQRVMFGGSCSQNQRYGIVGGSPPYWNIKTTDGGLTLSEIRPEVRH